MSNILLRGRQMYQRAKPLLMILYRFFLLLPRTMRVRMFMSSRGINGKLGIGIRYALIKSIAKACGDNVSIHSNVFIFHPENLQLGDNISIHPMCYIECGESTDGVRIDSDVSIAHSVSIIAATHNYNDSNIKIKDQGVSHKPIHIGTNTWIGAKASILAGICIAEGCIIGANSVVTKDTTPNCIYGGIPAKFIKSRII